VTSARPRVPLLVVGDLMVDTVVKVAREPTWGADQNSTITRRVGGQGANTAAWLAWKGVPVSLLATCGHDQEGQWALGQLDAMGVMAHVERVDGNTGLCVVIVDGDGERTMFSDAGANVRAANDVSPTWDSALNLSMDRHVHLSGYFLDRDPILAARILDACVDTGASVTVSLDASALPATAAHRSAVTSLLPRLDVLLGTVNELAALLPAEPAGIPLRMDAVDVAGRWREQAGFRGVVVVKEGAAGASADAGTGTHRAPAQVGSVVDTTGAGDAFAAGFLAAWTLDPLDLDAALVSGIDVATVAIGTVGGSPPVREGR
jgi:ribokinase